MNQREELVLEILSSVDVIQGKTKFVKILHLVCKLLEKNKINSPFNFKADRYGVNSPELEPLLQKLESDRYVRISKPIFQRRNDLSLIGRSYECENAHLREMKPKINSLVNALNPCSLDEILAISYKLYPDTTTNSVIKAKVNQKIIDLFSELSPRFEESFETVLEKSVSVPDGIPLSPQFNDLDVRIKMMKSMGLEKLPSIIPDIIDESTGIIDQESSLFKKINLEEILENARRH